MNTFLLSFDANTSFSGGNAPNLEILVGGVPVSSVVMANGAASYDLFIEFSGDFPSSLSFRFDGSSGDPGDTITFTAVSINYNALNLATDLTSTLLMQAQSSGVTASNSHYGHTTPTLGAPTITGTAGDDSNLKGTGAADIIDGLAGNDRILGQGDDDGINGGIGNDMIFGEAGNDTILGGAGDDLIYGDAGADTLFGEADNDTIIGGAGDDVINGGAGADGLIGDAGNDVIFGEDGDDWLVGVDGDDILFGDNGNDYIIGGDGDDALSGGDGIDQLIGGNDDDLMSGGDGADELIGGSGVDTIDGDAGADSILGGTGADIIDGGDDDDNIALYNGDFAAGESLTGGAGTDTITFLDATTVDFTTGTLATIETLTGSDDNDDATMSALQFVDFTTLDLGTGIDVLNVQAIGTVDISASGTPTISNVETGNLTGSTGNDDLTLTATQLDAIIIGAGIIDFAGGADVLNIDATSADLNTLGATDASILGLETISAAGAAAGVTIALTGQSENFTVTGSAFADTLTTGSGADTINGGAGNDVLTGGTGVDVIDGGNDDDTINLANGDFAASESLTGGAGTDEILLTNATTIDLSTGTIATVETLTGSGGNDTVTMDAAQFVDFTDVDLAGGTDIMNIFADDSDITASGFPTVSNVETGNLVGDGANNSITLTGAQLNAIIVGTGTIDLGAGASDTINLTSTSTDLNALGGVDASIQGLEIVSAATAAAGVTIVTTGQTEDLTFIGGDFNDILVSGLGDDTITGGTGNDIILAFGGVDTVDGGDNDDLIYLLNNDFAAGESLTGGAGTDTLFFGNATTADLSTGTLATIELMTGSFGNDNITLTDTQWVDFTTINMGGGTDTINVLATGDISASSTPTVSNLEIGNLVGTTGNDTMTLTGAQLDTILEGTGTIDFDAGAADVMNLTSTSTELNTLGATDASILGLETISASGASAGVTISLTGQTEGFTVTGSAFADALTTGSGADTINGGAGNDIITGGTGVDVIDGGNDDDTINLANGDFAAGESLTGGAGTDEILLTNATTVDLSTGTIATIETLTGSVGDDTVTVAATQWSDFTDIDLAGGTDILNVFASGDISASGTPTLANIETGNLIGDGSDNSVTLSGTQLNAILIGTGTIDFGGGTSDVMNLTSTSIDLTTLGNSNDASIQGLEEISAASAAAAVNIQLRVQTEDFLLTGGVGGDILVTGLGDDTINGGGGNDIVAGWNGADTINGEGGNDIIAYLNGHWAAGEAVDGGAGTDTMQLFGVATVDFSTGTITSVENFTGSGGNDTVTFSDTQWVDFTTINMGGGTDVLNVLATGDISASGTPTVSNLETGNLVGTTGNDTMTLTGAQLNAILQGTGIIDFDTGAADVMNLTSTSTELNTLGATDASILGLETISAASAAAGVTITLTGQSEDFTVTGSGSGDTLSTGSGADTINGGAGNDVLTGGTGADVIDGGNDNDTINLANGDFAAGESLTGGAGTDSIVFTNSTSVNFTTGTIATIETLTGSGSNDRAILSDSQWADLTTIDLAGGTDMLNVLASSDISALGTPTISNVEIGNLTGTTGNDTTTMTGTQLNAIIIGSGTINFGAGASDILNLTSTSTDLNTLGATDASIAGLETISASGAAAGVTISLTGQTEGFTVTGSTGDDTITTGSGADTINGNDGVDVLDSGAGDDTINSGSTLSASISTILTANSEAIITTNGWIIHTYSATGSHTFTAPTGVTQVDYLAVGGGGGGGGFASGNVGGGGGGGAGEVDEVSGYSVVAGSNYTVSVGAGGAGGVGGTSMAGTGGTSSFDGNTALGGGGGGTNGVNNNGANGASGGGGRLNGSGGTGSDGNDGGDGAGATASTAGAGGGGGAGSAGADGSGNNGGDGGDGVTSNISGVDIYYGAGGGGGAYRGSGSGGNGGAGGGGSAPNTRAAGVDGLDGRGSGGSGATGSTSGSAFVGGDGGDGMVIVAYQMTIPDITRLIGGTGNDELYGSGGMDIFEFSDTGAANEDTIFNFDAQIDKLDLSDLLTGYDDTTDLITDYVQIADSGGDSEIRVDTGGTGSFGATTVVATIDSITGLTNEANLEAYGIIITM